jgi:parvulin-like peptidyl-prolyl isomerase
VIARVNGRDVTIQDYTAYLFASMGKAKLREFVDRVLMEEEGRVLEVTITPEDVEERVNGQIDSTVRALYQNKMESFEENLRQRGLTLEDHKAKLRQDTAYRLLEERSIMKIRKITDEDIKAEFEKRYGEAGVLCELRHILVSTRARSLPAADARKARTDQEAKEQADKIMKSLKEGRDFNELVRAFSEDELTKKAEGRIPHYQKGYRGREFDEAVARLTEPNQVSDPVRSTQGYHIIQLISRKMTKLEEKRDEIVNFLKTRAPTPQERNAFMKSLREKAKIEM